MKKDLVIAVVAVLAVLGITYVLAVAIPDSPLAPSPALATTSKASIAKPSGRVVMHVNGEPVTEAEFNQFLNEAPAEQRPMYAAPAGRRMLADEMVKVKALEQEARRLGVENDPEVQAQIAMVTSQIRAGKALQKLIGTPDEKALRAEYEKERQNFETVELAHILVAYEGGAAPPRTGKPLDAAAAMIKARQIAQQLRDGADFGAMARSQSDDQQSAQQGGRLGDVPIAALPPDIRPAIANLKPGQISDAVRSQFGIHVFRAGERKSRKFEDLRNELETRLKRAKLEETMLKLQSSTKVDLDPKFFPEPKPAPADAPNPGVPVPRPGQ